MRRFEAHFPERKDKGKKGKPGKQDKGVNEGGKFDKAKGGKTQP